ncbi:MAG TPA: Mur ligase family protein, partial [Ferruginibacter sp.]|nr:Mur ligase family protein [Ferruginibacter sp.]
MSQRLVILGGGESGVGTALLAKQQGYEVFLSDSTPLKQPFRDELLQHAIDFEEGQHTEARLLSADWVMKSPGIPEKAPIVKLIRSNHIPVISEIEFAYRYIGNSKVVAITGSNGKTTTTALTYHIFNHAGADCALVGNIG